MTVSSKRSPEIPETGSRVGSFLGGIFLIFLAIFITLSFLISAMGILGHFFKATALFLAGNAAGIVPFILLICGIQLIVNGYIKLTRRNGGLLLLFILICCFLHSLSASSVSWSGYFGLVWQEALAGQGGGLIGAIGYYLIALFFGHVGFYIVEVVLVVLAASLINRKYMDNFFRVLLNISKKFASYCKKLFLDFFFEKTESEPVSPAKEKKSKKNPPKNSELEEEMPYLFNFEETMAKKQQEKEQTEASSDLEAEIETKIDLPILDDDELELKDIWEPQEQFADLTGDYQLPPHSLLIAQEKPAVELSKKEAAAKTQVLEETFRNFGIDARVSEISIGPAITRYEIQPPPGVKVSRIMGLADDLSLSLASAGIRIEAPIPGKAAVGIEVPNNTISPVTLQELVECKAFNSSAAKLTVILGKDIAGSPITTDLAKMPHLLIAGATGSGKSVCVNTLISSILFRAKPSEVKFLMVDPKMVELSAYSGIPHLISPVVTDAKKAAGTLHWAVMEMDRRYQLFADSGVKDLERYNAQVAALDPELEPLPFIVIIIDELADLMMVASREVEDSICRLAQKARASGMHLVVATQRPSVDVITGLIKANIPSRISFAVSSQMDSRTILDSNGAEKLLGKGDMLFFPVGFPKPIRVQGAYLSDQEVESLVEFIKKQAEPVYNEEVLNTPLPENSKATVEDDEDELLGRAVRLFLESNTASISLLQRRLHIGYARAARLVDTMEQRGIVGSFEGNKPRAILMTMEEFNQTFPNANQ